MSDKKFVKKYLEERVNNGTNQFIIDGQNRLFESIILPPNRFHFLLFLGYMFSMISQLVDFVELHSLS